MSGGENEMDRAPAGGGAGRDKAVPQGTPAEGTGIDTGIDEDGNAGTDGKISSGGSGSLRTPPSGATDEGRDYP
ncbi:hypothetical protein [Arenibaculum pallidiluteum]|uniref:hypothetical protein n=1 Tax=Arenibaculum pallidiluteum TaxID=2812559 RepID=UPI001A956D34|nr:hypothetical protein [Arenibaculum pallidiluteum]